MVKKQKISREYKIDKFVINSQSLHDFEIMENRRMISDVHVGKIRQTLIDGKNPVGVLIVNKKNGKMRLIDGNHRIEAVKRFFEFRKEENRPDIECTLKIYENLSEDEEKEVYSNEAKRRNESHEDRLNLYKDSLTFWNLISGKLDNALDKFPINVSIYSSVRSIKFRTILDMIYSSKKGKERGFNPSNLKKEEIIEFAHNCLYDDFISLKNFFNVFKESFGNIGENNLYCRKSILVPLYDIYVKNQDITDTKQVIERFKNIPGKGDVIMYVNMGNNKEVIQKIRELLLNHINKGYSTNKFL